MSTSYLIPETRVLAIASHVVYGYVGNTMAVFVMQAFGCEVAALNTVHFSNHTGYGQWKGTKATAQDIQDIYDGLQQSYLTDFDVLLSGYAPSAKVVEAIGSIARDLKLKASTRPGSFFWILDPVMGDDGRLYVSEDVIPVYQNLLHDADLILPNQFEAEVLAETKITNLSSLADAIAKLHKTYQVPHIIITSVQFDASSPISLIVGSTARADGSPRLFKIGIPAIDCFFSGTGDMFAALAMVRLREAIIEHDLTKVKSWVSPDNVEAVDLPLAKAAEKVLGSMHTILQKTKTERDEALKGIRGETGISELEGTSEKRSWLRKTKAAEVRVVRHLKDLREPEGIWKAQRLGDGNRILGDGEE